MIHYDFTTLLTHFLTDGQITQPRALGLADFAPATLANADFDLIGEHSDWHFWEREIQARHGRRNVELGYKRYFSSDRDIGDGFDVAPGVRLTTVLHHCLANRALQFYFWDNLLEGAVIVDETIVMRFSTNHPRGAYHLRTLESDLPSLEASGRISTSAVRASLQPCDLLHSPLPRHAPAAYKRLRLALRPPHTPAP